MIHPKQTTRNLPSKRAWKSLLAVPLIWGGTLTAAPSLLVTNATLVTMAEATPEPFTGYFTVDAEGRIETLGAGTPPSDLQTLLTYDAEGKVIMPGFLSGHSHLWQSAFRGRAADEWVLQWIDEIHRVYGPQIVPGDLYAYTLHGTLDYLRHGITTIYNYAWMPNDSMSMYDEQVTAANDGGAHYIFGYIVTPFPSIEVVHQRFSDFMERWSKVEMPLLLKMSLSSSGVDFTPEYTQFEFDLMREFDLDMQLHYLEAPDVQERQRRDFPFLEQADALSPKLAYAHFIHTSDEIVEKSGAAGVGMIWNPLSNGRLASGFADIPKFQEAGMRIGMGIDGQASADISDPFENMRMGLYQTRMRYESAKILQPFDVLRMHTLGTAEVLGVEKDVGSLEVGKYADFIVVDPTEMDTGSVTDLYATLVFTCSIANIDRIYVAGEFLVERGTPRFIDVEAVNEEVARRVAAAETRLEASLQP